MLVIAVFIIVVLIALWSILKEEQFLSSVLLKPEEIDEESEILDFKERPVLYYTVPGEAEKRVQLHKRVTVIGSEASDVIVNYPLVEEQHMDIRLVIKKSRFPELGGIFKKFSTDRRYFSLTNHSRLLPVEMYLAKKNSPKDWYPITKSAALMTEEENLFRIAAVTFRLVFEKEKREPLASKEVSKEVSMEKPVKKRLSTDRETMNSRRRAVRKSRGTTDYKM